MTKGNSSAYSLVITVLLGLVCSADVVGFDMLEVIVG